jgi:hypothetical protein
MMQKHHHWDCCCHGICCGGRVNACIVYPRSEGKIYEHSVDNVVLRDPPLGISPLWTNLSRIFNPQPQPCPGLMCPFSRLLGVAVFSAHLQIVKLWESMRLQHPFENFMASSSTCSSCTGINFDNQPEKPLHLPAPAATRCVQWTPLTQRLPRQLPGIPSRQRHNLLLE